jgi:pilus assembly protein TadC
MIRLVRITGFLMVVAGALVILTWLIEPLREIWPLLRSLPWPIQLGLAMAGIGLVVVMATLIWERMEERESDKSLIDEP